MSDHLSANTCSTHLTVPLKVAEIDLNGINPGEVNVDISGVEWVCRRCFCGLGDCAGKALRRVDGKEELDAWDRGRLG